MRNIIIGTLAVSVFGFGCGQYKDPVSSDTISNKNPISFHPEFVKSSVEDGNMPREYWYPSIGPFPICSGCESITAYVANNTGRDQRIGLAVYKRLPDGSDLLYAREYAIIRPNSSPSYNEYQQILIINGSPVGCAFNVYLTQIDTNFDSFVPNVATDGYLIAVYSSPGSVCN